MKKEVKIISFILLTAISVVLLSINFKPEKKQVIKTEVRTSKK